MARNRISGKDKEERILVLAVDIDNDLYRKTKISGPLIGRVQNLNAATQLALADPEDTDSNAMFEAVKIYDELKEKGHAVNVATVTGAETEGYDADREVARQLELILEQYKADSCLFVTDGASDKRVLPIVQSRVKINSVRIVTLKQAEGLENTYFAVLEKLKEPHYSRIIFGIPALLILLFAVSYFIGLGWELPAALIGLYLLVKGFGFEDTLINSFRGFGFSIDRVSFAFYFAALVFLAISVFIAVGDYNAQLPSAAASGLQLEYAVEGFLIFLPLVLILYLLGRIIDVKISKSFFREFKYGMYIGSSLILWVLLYSLMAWIIGQIYFSQFLLYTIAAIAIGVGVSYFVSLLRRRVLKSKRLKDKLIVNELGALIGKISGLDIRRGRLLVNTSFGTTVTYSVDRIVEISDTVVIK